MGRITSAQKAGLDFLDQIFFNDLVVHRGMDAEERRQLDMVILRVKQMAESRHSGREAEIVKHLAYCLLEVSLTNTTNEWMQVFPGKALPPDLSWETVEAVDHFTSDLQMAFMLVLTEKSTGFDASYAFEIAETLKAEFAGYSALVRRDLVKRCLAREFSDVSVGVYCWLSVAGVLAVTKNSSDRICSEFSERFMTRLTLLADYEMITHGLNVMVGKDNFASAFLGQPQLNLNKRTIVSLLDIQKTFQESLYNSSLHGIPLINLRDVTSTEQVQLFFDQWGRRKTRLRMHTNSLASWLGILGAGMVEMQLLREYQAAAQEKFGNGVQSVQISELKVAAIFNACDNRGTITELVKDRLLAFGLKINPDTLYRSHSKMRKSILRLVSLYCHKTRDAGVVMSAIYDDTFYGSTFIQADKLAR